MGTYNSAILTTAGQSLIASAISGGGTVQFTSVQTSSYAYPAGTNIPSLTELQDVRQTVEPFSAQVFNDTMIQVSSRFDNSAVSEAYLIQTLGIFAQLGSNPAVLFAVVQATTADQMPDSSAVSPSAFIYNVQITVQQASSITVTVNPAGTATVQDILDIQANYVPNSKIDNNLLGNDPTHVLASPQGAALAGQISQLNSDMGWKNAGNTDDRSVLNLPSSYNEICITAYINKNVVFFATLPRSIIQDVTTTYAASGRVGSNVLSIRISLSKSSVQITNCYIDDVESSKSASIGLTVYYR